ncbi:uncharacterized protein SPPG_08249 [Spizellomyces punctatus DAOM BR117]|uniref:C2H2-type domain-containing protein n=1 Tax=Spizellomyces punctatus (strain DAOM BR117) TaxID=645134 RepID=A0A0L0H6I8_SPIPD|nr:uncharacterized protein SPPG_08249 [Spizellomyces punctatus DAOM BR117]KNC96348.1 hypothetical protein SPPG_08249 [Spizellomyces punctatus DAOM BR117]|eukprot:XP_016604388.1 hypothetical protein SPPG_08249 [Spizellomyces punctatus DAOM BR117]
MDNHSSLPPSPVSRSKISRNAVLPHAAINTQLPPSPIDVMTLAPSADHVASMKYHDLPSEFQSKSHIPDRPPAANGRYWCKWQGCFTFHDSEEDFVHHVGGHVNTLPWSEKASVTDKAAIFGCKWEGCGNQKHFEYRQRLIEHLRTHTDERPFLCPVRQCAHRFTVRSNCMSHVINVHRRKLIPIQLKPGSSIDSILKEKGIDIHQLSEMEPVVIEVKRSEATTIPSVFRRDSLVVIPRPASRKRKAQQAELSETSTNPEPEQLLPLPSPLNLLPPSATPLSPPPSSSSAPPPTPSQKPSRPAKRKKKSQDPPRVGDYKLRSRTLNPRPATKPAPEPITRHLSSWTSSLHSLQAHIDSLTTQTANPAEAFAEVDSFPSHIQPNHIQPNQSALSLEAEKLMADISSLQNRISTCVDSLVRCGWSEEGVLEVMTSMTRQATKKEVQGRARRG